jgi:hypothetical protein
LKAPHLSGPKGGSISLVRAWHPLDERKKGRDCQGSPMPY